MPLDSEIIERVRDSLPGSTSWSDIYSKIRDRVPEGEEQAHRSLVWAFGYHLLAPENAEAREREGSAFGPLIEFEGGRIPPRLLDVPEEDVEDWVEIFDAIDNARVRSRVGDLLWERKQKPRPDENARGACIALVELVADPEWQPMESTLGLARALELARSVSDDGLVQQVVEAMVSVLEVELSGNDDRPGIPFSLLRELVDLPAPLQPSGLRALIVRARERYGADPHHTETGIDLEARLARDEELAPLRQQQVQAWRAAAEKADGILRVTFLERALDAARAHGLADEAKDIRVELGSLTEEELDLKTVSSEIRVDSEQLDSQLARFVEFDRWEDSLSRFGIYGPPGGEPDAVESQVEELMRKHPIQFLVTKTIIDPDSQAAIFHAVDEESHKKVAAAERLTLGGRLWSVFAVDVLHRVESKYGHPSTDDLTKFFTSPFIDEVIAEGIGHSLHLWWQGNYDDCAHALAPRLEAVIRELARQLGIPIIREPSSGKPGGVRSLGDLLFSMEGRLPTPGWHAYLIHLLIDPLGLNLRNVVGHGLRPSISAEDAALLLHAACFLRLVAPQPGEEATQNADAT